MDSGFIKYEDITTSWDDNNRMKEFEQIIDKWLYSFEDKERPFLLELLKHFHYYGETAIKKKITDLFSKFSSVYSGDLNRVKFTKIYKKYGVAFSDIFVGVFWYLNILYPYTEPNIVGMLEQGDVPDVIAIVDDYSGSGKSLKDTIDVLIETNSEVKDSRFYFVVLHITEIAKKSIREYAKERNIKISVVSLEESKKTFESGYIYSNELVNSKKQQYKAICKSKGIEQDIFGRYHVASLVAFHYNTPNDTLRLFWHDSENYHSIFPRFKKPRNTSLKEMKNGSNNRKIPHKNVGSYGGFDFRTARMITYCVISHNFSLIDFMNEFGITAAEANERLREFVLEGCLINLEGGSFRLSEKMTDFKTINNGFNRNYSAISQHEEYVPKNF